MIQGDAFPEIRAYLNLLKRRWYIVAVPFLLALAYGIYSFGVPDSYYTVGLRYIVSQPPTDGTTQSDADRRWTWVTSQYVVNSMTDWGNGTDFAYRVAEEMAQSGTIINAESLNRNMDVFTERSKLTILVNHHDKEELEQIMETMTVVLNKHNGQAIPQVRNQPATVEPIDRINVVEVAPSLTAWLRTPIIIAFGLAVGLGIALILEYFDPRVYGGLQLNSLGLPLISTIPKE